MGYRRRTGLTMATVLALGGAFFGYWRMSRTVSINSDGASNAIQAWDMLHGNVLLNGWTVTDVSFYTTELIQYMALELIVGYQSGVIHIAAAMTYTLALALAAMVAKGSTTGWVAARRIAVVLAIMLVPGPITGYTTVLGSPAHFGTSVPLLITWLILDRAAGRRWLPYAIAVLLAWGMVADPLVMYIGALPLAVVSLIRMTHARRWRGPDAGLALAAVASVALAEGFLTAIRGIGGFHVHPPIVEVAPLSRLDDHLWLLVKSIGVLYGTYFPELPGPFGVAVGVLKLLGVLLVLVAAVTIGWTTMRRGDGDRVAQVLAFAIAVNCGAFLVSTLPTDLLTARQLAAVLPLGAALAGRVMADRLARQRLIPARSAAAIAVSVLAVFTLAFGIRATDPPTPNVVQAPADFLAARGLTHGVGSYWAANAITLTTGGTVTVAPTIGVNDQIMGYRWESLDDWYDPDRYDARFLVIDLDNPGYGQVDEAVAQFGAPAERHNFGRFTVLLYDRDLLDGLPAFCVPQIAAKMSDCP